MYIYGQPHNHQHDGCEHNIKHCKVCDVAYCTKCKKEWSAYRYWWNGTTITSPNWTYMTDNTTNNTFGLTAINHTGGDHEVPS